MNVVIANSLRSIDNATVMSAFMTTICESNGMARLVPLLLPFLVMTTCISSIGVAAQQGTYFVGPERLTWPAARAYCKKHGADLVTIETAEENEHVKRLVQQKSDSGAGCWIGATDIGQEGEWRWVNGKALAPYSNWHHGEHFAHMWPDGTWNDQKRDGSCNGWGLMQPVCERRGVRCPGLILPSRRPCNLRPSCRTTPRVDGQSTHDHL